MGHIDDIARNMAKESNYKYGAMDCKRALQETNGDIEKAKEWLNEKIDKTFKFR